MTALSLPAGLLPVWAIPTSRTQTSNRSVSNHPTDFLRRFPPCSSAKDSTTPLLFTRGYLGLWGRSGLRLSLAGSPIVSGRIEFVIILRTGCSPLVAPHPALRRRSYVQLHADTCPHGWDFHPAVCVRLWAHWGDGVPAAPQANGFEPFRRHRVTRSPRHDHRPP
jgi:hypothetical protein